MNKERKTLVKRHKGWKEHITEGWKEGKHKERGKIK